MEYSCLNGDASPFIRMSLADGPKEICLKQEVYVEKTVLQAVLFIDPNGCASPICTSRIDTLTFIFRQSDIFVAIATEDPTAIIAGSCASSISSMSFLSYTKLASPLFVNALESRQALECC